MYFNLRVSFEFLTNAPRAKLKKKLPYINSDSLNEIFVLVISSFLLLFFLLTVNMKFCLGFTFVCSFMYLLTNLGFFFYLFFFYYFITNFTGSRSVHDSPELIALYLYLPQSSAAVFYFKG